MDLWKEVGGITMNYRPSVNFTDHSNAYARGERKVCKNHLLGVWGKDQFGNFYTKCAQGNKFNESCEELKEDEHAS